MEIIMACLRTQEERRSEELGSDEYLHLWELTNYLISINKKERTRDEWRKLLAKYLVGSPFAVRIDPANGFNFPSTEDKITLKQFLNERELYNQLLLNVQRSLNAKAS